MQSHLKKIPNDKDLPLRHHDQVVRRYDERYGAETDAQKQEQSEPIAQNGGCLAQDAQLFNCLYYCRESGCIQRVIEQLLLDRLVVEREELAEDGKQSHWKQGEHYVLRGAYRLLNRTRPKRRSHGVENLPAQCEAALNRDLSKEEFLRFYRRDERDE